LKLERLSLDTGICTMYSPRVIFREGLMLGLFFRNISFIYVFLSIFTTDGFSAKKVYPDHIKSKFSFLNAITEQGISRSDIFEIFSHRNLKDVSFRYTFLPLSYLKKEYTTERGFSSDFAEDAVRGFTSEKDSLRLLQVFYKSYQKDMNELGQQSKRSFPRILEFVPNTKSFFNVFALSGITDNPPYKLGLYCVSVFYKDSNNIDTGLLQYLLENSLKFRPEKKRTFLGDKQKLKEIVLQEGLLKSRMMKNFILGNDIESIHFYFTFQTDEDLIYNLRRAGLSDGVISTLCSENNIDYRDFFQSRASDLFDTGYRSNLKTVHSQMMYYSICNRPVTIIVPGLLQVLISNEYLRQTLNDDQGTKKGVYFIFAGFACDADQVSTLLPIYLPYPEDNLMILIEHYSDADDEKKKELIDQIYSLGITKSSIFQEYIEKNELKKIFFEFMFISKSTLEKIFPCGVGDCPSADKLLSRNINESNRVYLKKELYYSYLIDFDSWKASGFSKALCPNVLELLTKNPVTTDLINPGCKDLDSEEGLYLVHAFHRVHDNENAVYPKRRKPPENWRSDRVSIMSKLSPQLYDEVEGLSSVY